METSLTGTAQSALAAGPGSISTLPLCSDKEYMLLPASLSWFDSEPFVYFVGSQAHAGEVVQTFTRWGRDMEKGWEGETPVQPVEMGEVRVEVPLEAGPYVVWLGVKREGCEEVSNPWPVMVMRNSQSERVGLAPRRVIPEGGQRVPAVGYRYKFSRLVDAENDCGWKSHSLIEYESILDRSQSSICQKLDETITSPDGPLPGTQLEWCLSGPGLGPDGSTGVFLLFQNTNQTFTVTAPCYGYNFIQFQRVSIQVDETTEFTPPCSTVPLAVTTDFLSIPEPDHMTFNGVAARVAAKRCEVTPYNFGLPTCDSDLEWRVPPTGRLQPGFDLTDANRFEDLPGGPNTSVSGHMAVGRGPVFLFQFPPSGALAAPRETGAPKRALSCPGPEPDPCQSDQSQCGNRVACLTSTWKTNPPPCLGPKMAECFRNSDPSRFACASNSSNWNCARGYGGHTNAQTKQSTICAENRTSSPSLEVTITHERVHQCDPTPPNFTPADGLPADQRADGCEGICFEECGGETPDPEVCGVPEPPDVPITPSQCEL